MAFPAKNESGGPYMGPRSNVLNQHMLAINPYAENGLFDVGNTRRQS
jgi:hypothetical protein